MLTWTDEFNSGYGRSTLDAYAVIRRLHLEPNFSLLPTTPQEVEAVIRDLWPRYIDPYDWIDDSCAWFSTALAAGLERAFKREQRAIARTRCTFSRAHTRKPKCGFGGFFSAEKVNLRNAP
ncbi:hypothetical protein [Variovorax sp. JS1663]|uniref:hypothetical protein n=1 Tax=Variovorax sp. JS1663 TaxID=1851577 RepID=UPI000B343AC8|nr:hypothetical protein [Variovorax sp. JS1663]OUM00038.1 hypothetical protein A8M77_22905 [Variovorax sp. JS1663]